MKASYSKPKNQPYTPTKDQLSRCFKKDFIHFYQHFLEKKILLVGGSESVDDFNLNDYSDYSVVQLNNHLLRRPKQRCDWLISREGSGMDIEMFKSLAQRESILYVSTACNKRTFEEFYYYPVFLWPFYEGRYIKTNPYHPGLEWCNQLWNELQTNPVVGMLALKMVQLLPVSEIKLIGFDFWHDKTKGFELMRSGCHYTPSLMNWLKHQYNTDFRIQLDKETLDILKIKDRGYFITSKPQENHWYTL
jgi:hypothetical protein